MVRGVGDGARQRVIASPGGVRIRTGNPNALLSKAPETSPAHHGLAGPHDSAYGNIKSYSIPAPVTVLIV